MVSILACAGWTAVAIHIDATAIGEAQAHYTSKKGSRVGTEVQMEIIPDAQTRALDGNDLSPEDVTSALTEIKCPKGQRKTKWNQCVCPDGQNKVGKRCVRMSTNTVPPQVAKANKDAALKAKKDARKAETKLNGPTWKTFAEKRMCCDKQQCQKYCSCAKGMAKQLQNECPCDTKLPWQTVARCEKKLRRQCDGGKCCSNRILHSFAKMRNPYVTMPCKHFSSFVDVDQLLQNQSQHVSLAQRRDQVGISQDLDKAVAGKCEE